jgi:ATP-dependent Clp protease ATP-binding subunit ClpB
MLLAGDVKDGETVPVTVGAEGLLVGERVGRSGRPRPEDAVLH